MRPKLQFLGQNLIERIVSEALDLLANLGVEVQNGNAAALLGDHGASVDLATGRVTMPEELVLEAVKKTPATFALYDVLENQTHDLSGDNVHFTPGSSGISVLDSDTGTMRTPVTNDLIRFAKLTERLEHIDALSTAFICSDVPGPIQDSYRLFLCFLYAEKPVVTGAFTIASYELMRNLQIAVRGSADALAKKPLTIFSCCPTAPLKWSDVTAQNLLDCAADSVPVELISMPLTGFVGPVTLVGSLVQHTAETLSGVVLSQLANPGCPVLYGGSPAAFDMRYETTPMGAVETQMMDCAYSEIGKHLGIPTQAYIGLSDSKTLDAQAGLETSMGATLAALAGINSISGPGMLDFETCISFEKLVVDNEICGLTKRMVRGIEPKDDFPARPHFEEMLEEGHLLISEHTRKHLRSEHYFPGPVIERANLSRWREEGSSTLDDRAKAEVQRHLGEYEPSRLDEDIKRELVKLMSAEAKRHGMDTLPDRED
ncbi:trimethylamine methyltransferase family protein [bacterium]|nr:trimethylamine methyltransferase family protein [bacterium]